MKTTVKGAIAILCVIGSLYMISGCANSDFLLEDNGYESSESRITRGSDDSPYYFYDSENRKIYLTLNTEFVFFSIKELMPSVDLSISIAELGAKAAEFRIDAAATKQVVSQSIADRHYTELSFEKKLSEEQYLTLLSELRNRNKGAIVAPYFSDTYGNKIGLSNFFYVKLKKEDDTDVLEKMAGQIGCVIIRQDEYMPLWYKLSVTETTERTALECANFFHESGLFASAEPDLMAELVLSPNDTYYAQQWGFEQYWTKWRYERHRYQDQ